MIEDPRPAGMSCTVFKRLVFMRSSLRIILLLMFGLAMQAGQRIAGTASVDSKSETALSLKEMDRLIENLSEPEGYFDSDNFISNEAGYLKILPLLREEGIRGGVYLGVGPDQNYSYIAEIRPRLAILVDIRRQNLIQHLYFKALFQLSSSRARFLERLFARRIPDDSGGEEEPSISQLLDRIGAVPEDPRFARHAVEEAVRVVNAWDFSLTDEDLDAMRYVARAFIEAGPDLRFSSLYRKPRQHYPSCRTLLLETDSTGKQASYLSSEERFRAVKSLHKENRIIPVVGDLAGTLALPRIARTLKERGLGVSCFYLSNVEFYLFRQGRWPSYMRNMRQLPWSGNAVLIRTYANSWRRHPAQIPGYYMTTLLQIAGRFFQNESAGKNQTYWDLVSQDYIAP
jgi:hypothetical protein